MFVIHTRLTVLVAGQAGETAIIVRVFVALGAAVPFPTVRARIYGEKLTIMNAKISRFPAWLGGMAEHTISGESRCLVGRIRR